MVRYSRSSSQTPVWVTSQAMLALSRKAFPFRAPGRAAEHRKAAAVASGGTRAKHTRAKHAAKQVAKHRAKAKPPSPAAPAPPATTPRSAALTRARSEARHESDRNGGDPWALELALATLPIAGLALWRRRWLKRRYPAPT
jgi:hypothetical protein